MNMNKVVVKIDKDFTVIPNEIIRNKEMSCNAKMILITMLSLPPEWDFSVNGLALLVKEGRDAVSSALKELEKFGYITRKRERFSDGTLGVMVYTVYQYPVEESERTLNTRGFEPKTEKPTLAEPTLDNPKQYNKDYINNQNNKESTNRYNSANESHDRNFDLKIMQKVTEITADNMIISGIGYYLWLYTQRTKKSHPDVSKSALNDIVHNIQTVLQDVWEEVENENGLNRMIGRHFITDYGKDIDYNLVHFGQEQILYYQARNVGLICGRDD